jgi:hypothetical protein
MSELKYNVCFTLGDPGGDGHANTSDYHMVSNHPAKEIDEAYKKAIEILGFDFVDKVGADYQDSKLREPYFSILVEKGVIKKEDYEYEYKGEIHLDTYLDEDDFIDIFEGICQLVLPDLVIGYRDLKEQQIFSLEGAAYGIAYHGE